MITLMRRLPLSGLALLAATVLASTSPAQPNRDADLLRQARQQRELATQKAEADLRGTLTKIKGLSASESLAALKARLTAMQEASDLDETRRTAIVVELQRAIRHIESDARLRGEKLNPTVPAVKAGKVDARRVELETQESERLRVKESVSQINQLLGQRRSQEAERKAQDLAQQYPANAAARLMGQKASLQVRIRDARELLDRQEASVNAAMKDVTKSSTLPAEDVEYDKNRWREISKSKFRGTGDPLTEKETAILKAMSKTIQPDFKGTKFDDAIDQLQQLIGATIVVDKKAMEEAMLGTDATINFSLPRAVTVRTILRKVLQENGLAYVIRDEMIHVTTMAKVREMMTTRTYYLGDITTGNALTTPPWLMAQQEETVVKYIIDSIKRSVDPMSWEGDGGKASISYDPISKALIVRQSAEVHMLLRNSMR